MRTLLVIGIGTGNPEHMTIQAIRALNTADVVFALDKGRAKADLVDLRREICARYLTEKPYRFVEAQDPERDRNPADYGATVEAWHAARAALYEAMIAGELEPEGCGAILVWGDPSLYDSTLRILDRIGALYAVEAEVRGQPPDARHRARLDRSQPGVAATGCSPAHEQAANVPPRSAPSPWVPEAGRLHQVWRPDRS